MDLLIIGYGSIGRRHARLLSARGLPTAVVSRQRETDGFVRFESVAQAFAAQPFTHAVICNATADHAAAAEALRHAGFTGKLLVEKPVFAHAGEAAATYPFEVRVAYQLRFHPVIAALREALGGETALSAHVYVGQHLAQWRPGRDVKHSYSAHRAHGGGAMRDLSHEIDLAQFLFGPAGRHYGLARRASDVTADSEDVAGFVLCHERCALTTMQMNYLDHTPRREWIITTPSRSLAADLIAGTVQIGGERRAVACGPDDAYVRMHEAWLSGGDGLCSLDEALAVARIIDGADYG